MPGPGPVAVVTDSTACLSADVLRARDIAVVPLRVVIGTTSYDEGVPDGVTPQQLADAMAAKSPVSTSRPNPEEMLETYERLAAAGAQQVLAVHLSSQLSGTCESAQLAAERSPVPVTVVDSRQVGAATGFSVLAAADVLGAGGGVEEAAEAARRTAAGTRSLFYVDTLEYLRRGGRVGALGALVGSALAVKPILTVSDGKVTPLERVRTSAKALSRLEELAVEAAGSSSVDVAVAHLASADRATELAERLGERLSAGLEGRSIGVGEISAVLGVHAGPGTVAVVVAPHNPPAQD
ncbi:MAG: DegV family protein [Marmoricola sp.]|nr:DegV family protein [Marmoricola sp.]